MEWILDVSMCVYRKPKDLHNKKEGSVVFSNFVRKFHSLCGYEAFQGVKATSDRILKTSDKEFSNQR